MMDIGCLFPGVQFCKSNYKGVKKLYDLSDTGGRSDRLFRLIEWLSGIRYGATVTQIAQAMDKSEKTVRRDLKVIDDNIGIKLIKERGSDRKYRYRIKKESTRFRLPPLNTYEVLSLYFTRGFSHFRDIPFIQNHLTSLFRKISDIKAGAGNEFLGRVSNLFIMPRELGGRVLIDWNNVDFLEKLISSALYFNVCEINYHTMDGEKIFRVGVLHFFNYRDALYILGKNIDDSRATNEVVYINLALHRIDSVKVKDNETFEYPADFNAEKFFDSDIFCFDEDKEIIKLKFAPHTRQYITEREWFPDQEVDILQDGSVVLSFESDTNMILKGWIRGFGPDVEVLEPGDLRNQMLSDLKQCIRQYE